nr:hypothetical protein [Rhizobium halophilum]
MSEGEKDRPCAIVIVSKGTGRVTVVPITHSYPEPGEHHLSLEVPPEVARQIGLDLDVNYVRLSEVNRFRWPGDHLRPLPGDPGRVHYGMVPRVFFEEIRKRIADLVRQELVRQTVR